MRERNRLAREMHDSLGHALVSIANKLEAVRLLYPVDPERATKELDDTTALVRSTMTELHHSLAGLRPAAQHVALSLAVRDGAAVLEVSDDGVGPGGAPRPGSGGLGVLGMRERIEALGGTLTIGPRSDRGTVLRARIPVSE